MLYLQPKFNEAEIALGPSVTLKFIY